MVMVFNCHIPRTHLINGRAVLLRRPKPGKAAALPHREVIYEMASYHSFVRELEPATRNIVVGNMGAMIGKTSNDRTVVEIRNEIMAE
jgi:hypothetical protein